MSKYIFSEIFLLKNGLQLSSMIESLLKES